MDNSISKVSSPDLVAGRPAAPTRVTPAAPVATGAGPGRQGRGDSSEGLAEAVSKINEFIQVVRRNLVFSVDEATGRTVVTVQDADTDRVVRQIPSEHVLNIARNLSGLKGLLFKEKV